MLRKSFVDRYNDEMVEAFSELFNTARKRMFHSGDLLLCQQNGTMFGKDTVVVRKRYGKDGVNTGVSLLLYNNKDEEIDEIYTDSNYVEFCSLNQLYESTRRASLRVEDTLDEMLAVLK